MGKIGKVCCKCIHPCGGYCIISNPVTTTLTITGNHPAQLDLPIEYEVTNEPFYGQFNCRIEGYALVNEEQSTTPWSVDCRYVRNGWFDGIGVNLEKCCEPNYVPFFVGSIESFMKESTTYFARQKYYASKISIRAGTKVIDGEPVCGVYVTVCVIMARKFDSSFNRCARTSVSGSIRYQEVLDTENPCCDDSTMITISETLTENFPDAEATGCDPSQNYAAGGYIDEPPCTQEDEFAVYDPPELLIPFLYKITREVFLPESDSIGCDPFVVTLTPADDIDQICGIPLGNFNTVPEPMYWEWDTCSYTDDDPRIPAPGLVATLCGEHSCSPAYFAFFWDACTGAIPGGTNNATNILLNVDLPTPCATDAFTLRGLLDDCNYKKTITSRVRDSYYTTDIVDGEIMFGEMFDTWTLTIESDQC